MFRAIGFLPHLQLSSTWAFPGPVDSRVWIADTQIPFKISANQHNLYICSLCLLDSLHSMASNCPFQVQSLFIWGFQGSLDESSFPQLAGRNLRQPVRYLAQQISNLLDIWHSRTPQKGRLKPWGKRETDKHLKHISDGLYRGPGVHPCAHLVYTAPRTCEDILPDKERCKTR